MGKTPYGVATSALPGRRSNVTAMEFADSPTNANAHIPLVRSANCFGSALDEDMKFEELNLSFPKQSSTWKNNSWPENNIDWIVHVKIHSIHYFI